MSTQPWGPHGPTVADHTTTPNPTASSAPMAGFDEPAAGAEVMSGGGGGGLGAILANILISAVMVAILWIPTACLYPLTSLAGFVTAVIVTPILRSILPPDGGDVASLGGILAGAVVIFIVFRIEMRLASDQGFRLIRHAIRMTLLAIVAIPFVQLTLGAVSTARGRRASGMGG